VQLTFVAIGLSLTLKETKPARSVARGFAKTRFGQRIGQACGRVKNNSKFFKVSEKILGKYTQVREAYWEPIPTSGKLVITTSAVTLSSVLCIVILARPLPKALRRAHTHSVMGYIQKTKISGKDRGCFFALWLGMNGLVSMIEYGTYFGWGTSVSDFSRSALRIARTTCNGAYVAKYMSYEVGNILPRRFAVLSPLLDELQTKSGIVRTSLLGTALSTTKELDLWALPQTLPSIRTFPLGLDVVSEVAGE
jgi:hypothetical protein